MFAVLTRTNLCQPYYICNVPVRYQGSGPSHTVLYPVQSEIAGTIIERKEKRELTAALVWDAYYTQPVNYWYSTQY